MALIVHSDAPLNAETLVGVPARWDLTPVEAFLRQQFVGARAGWRGIIF